MTRHDVPSRSVTDAVIDARELARRPGSMLEIGRTIHAPEQIGTDVIAVPAGAPIALDLRLESVVEGILVSGSVGATAAGTCVRCLDPVELPVEAPVQELFAYADRADHHREVVTEVDEDEIYELQGDLLDLTGVLRDSVVPVLPFKPVCRPDCPGLCPQCGARLADDPGHEHEVLDPRWAALRGLAGDADGSDNGVAPAAHSTSPQRGN